MEKVKTSIVGRLRPLLNWEVGLYAVIVLVALAIRLWALGARAIHYDEGLHVLYAWRLFTGLGYHHEAWMHGPFQFYGTYPIYWLFGAGAFTARLLPVIFGTALVILPCFLRKQLGRWGALAVSVLITFSPVLLYYSRYARNDIYIAFWSLLLVVCMWRYFEEKKARYLYIGAAALSLSFCTKEVTYITVGIFVLFLFIISAKELAGRGRRRFDLKGLSPHSEYLILIGTLALPLFSTFIGLIPGIEIPSGFHWAKLLTIILFFIFSAVVGLRWNWRRWLISVLIFYSIFIFLYTSIFTNISSGLVSGFWGSADYWIEQHGVARGGQPWFYYIMLLPIYEFLPLFFAFSGAIYHTIKGNLFSRFLVYWTVLALVIYTYAGEKMPWLSLHIALPVILLGGMFIGQLLQEAPNLKGARAWVIRGVTVLVLLLLLPFSIHVAFQENYQKSDEPPQMLFYAGISSDVPPIMAEIDKLAQKTGEGKQLAITIDGELFYDGPAWYLRDYKNIDFSISQPKGSVLIIHTSSENDVDKSYLEKYGEGQKFHHLIWFPEEYRDFDLGWWWDYFFHRETRGPYWSQEGIVYFLSNSEF